MSTTDMAPATTSKRNRNLVIAGLSVALAAALGLMYFLNPTGAGFSGEEDGTVQASVGTVVVDISDDDTNVDLTFPGLGTDNPKYDLFTVTNGGTLDYRASISDADILGSSGDLTDAENAFQVKVMVDPEQDGTYETKQTWIDFSSLSSAVNLVDLAPGETADVKIGVRLDGANTPNSLQGAEVNGTFTVHGEEL